MGNSKWVSFKDNTIPFPFIDRKLLTDESVVALGYEDTFGHHRRAVQHALFVTPFRLSMFFGSSC